MKTSKMIALLALGALLAGAVADDALAQRRGDSSRSMPAGFEPHLEISGHWGHMWGGNIDFSYNQWNGSRKIRTGTGSSYGIQVGYNLHPMQAVELSYTRQDGKLDYDYQGLRTLFDMSINYWHIGSLRYLTPPGKVRPFVTASIGATYYSPSQSTFELDGETFQTQTSTKLSFSFGLGLKAYFGEAQKFGLRATFRTLPTLYDAGAGIWFGTGGAGLSVGGSAIWQWEAAVGATLRFGA